MALSFDINALEKAKFQETSTGETAVRVVFGGVNQNDAIALSILSASDKQKQFSWLDFGTKNERISSIQYTSASVGSYTLLRFFSYTFTNNNYRLDQEQWSLS